MGAKRQEVDPWLTAEADFPSRGTSRDRLRFALNYAVLAPSGHNTQPWRFRLGERHVDLLTDRARALPVVDPADRELVISCGAALLHLRLALRRFGIEPRVSTSPDPADHDLLARVEVGGAVEPTANDRALFAAIPRRRTTRRSFNEARLPDEGARRAWAEAARVEGARLTFVADVERRHALTDLIAEGDRAQFADPAFRDELARWIHRRRTGDGLSATGFGMPDLLAPVGAFVVRTFNLGGGVAAKDREVALHTSLFGVLSTAADTPSEWLACGQALARVLLGVTAAGATAAFVNQPMEVAALRPRLAQVAGTAPEVPQLLLRIGFGPEVPPSARRPVEAVLVPG
jgi:hypothetical protein